MSAKRKTKNMQEQPALPLADAPLPGTMMPRDEQERMVPGTRRAANDPIEGSRPVGKAHYTDGGDKDQTIPI